MWEHLPLQNGFYIPVRFSFYKWWLTLTLSKAKAVMNGQSIYNYFA